MLMQNIPNISQSINDILFSLPYLAAECTLVIGFVLAILIDLFSKRGYLVFAISMLTILVSGAFLIYQLSIFNHDLLLFNGMFGLTKTAIYFKLLVLFAAILSLVFFYQDQRLKQHPKGINDFVSIFLASILGMFLLISSANLMMLYLAIEMISLSSYLMVSYNAYQNKQAEGAIKYALFGAVASAMMLYGISLIYGFTGTLNLYGNDLINGLVQIGFAPTALALILVLAGIGFKLSFVPFHFWTPDAYEVVPTSVTSFLASVPKIAVFGMLFYILPHFQLIGQGLFSQVILVVSASSMILGNTIAIFQNDAKRMMAYSSVGHTGFILMLFLLPQTMILNALVFYLLTYTLMNAGTFAALCYLDNKFGASTISDFKGLGKKAPFIGVILIVLMVSLTGLPPTAGFIAKFLVFSSLIQMASAHVSIAILLVIAALTTVISLFYYLKIPLNFFLKTSELDTVGEQTSSVLLFMAALMAVAILILGVFPSLFQI
jgi:NADH-quinone oxidoreductase subunit N